MKKLFNHIRRFWKSTASGQLSTRQAFDEMEEKLARNAEPQVQISQVSDTGNDENPDVCPICGGSGPFTPSGHCWGCDVSYYS